MLSKTVAKSKSVGVVNAASYASHATLIKLFVDIIETIYAVQINIQALENTRFIFLFYVAGKH